MMIHHACIGLQFLLAGLLCLGPLVDPSGSAVEGYLFQVADIYVVLIGALFCGTTAASLFFWVQYFEYLPLLTSFSSGRLLIMVQWVPVPYEVRAVNGLSSSNMALAFFYELPI